MQIKFIKIEKKKLTLRISHKLICYFTVKKFENSKRKKKQDNRIFQ